MRRCIFVVMMIATTARAEPEAAKPDQPPETLDHLLARTNEIAHDVARVRGLKLKHAMPNEVVDRAELRKRLIAEAAEDKTATETAAEGLALQRWGFVPLDYDYGARVLDLLSDQIAGYYDPKTKKLTILDSAADDPDWASMVLTHELDHGLQDQAFDLEKFEKLPDDESDAALARHALVEGDGVTLMLEMSLAREGCDHPVAGAGGRRRGDRVDESRRRSTSPKISMSQAPLALREAMLFPVSRWLRVCRRASPHQAMERGRRRVQASAALDRADPARRQVPRRRQADPGHRRTLATRRLHGVRHRRVGRARHALVPAHVRRLRRSLESRRRRLGRRSCDRRSRTRARPTRAR